MKILHTSDWHLGHVLYNYSQEEEQQDMLKQMVAKVMETRPDAVLISGDVYDVIQPATGIQKMFADALVEMHNANPNMTIICIAGNHDSGSRHIIYETPWKALNVHMVGNISKDSNLNDYIFKIGDRGYVVAVPFAAERFMPADIYKQLGEKVAEMNDKEKLPVFLMAHMAIANSDYRGHELSTDTNIGGLNCQQLEVFGGYYDYVALGHIHKNQALDKEKHVYYAGTPIAVSFDEVYKDNCHGIMLAECCKRNGDLKTELLPLDNIRPLVNIPSDGFAPWDLVVQEFKDYPDDIPSYIRLNVEVDKYLHAGATDEARLIAQDKVCRFCVINAKRKEDTNQQKMTKTFTTSEFKALDPTEAARMWIEQKGEIFDDEIKDIIEETKQDIKQNPNRISE
mgnify:FL=1